MATTVSIVINGSEAKTRVDRHSLVIQDVINDAPNTCRFTIRGTAPVVNQTVRITVGGTYVFNGTIQSVDLTCDGRGRTALYRVTAADDLAKLNKIRPFGTWTSTSATTIATSLISTFASGFTSTNVAASLPSIAVTFDGSQTFSECLAQIAKLIGGYYYVEDGDLHLFLTEATSTPDTINSTVGRLMDEPAIVQTTDVTQLRTRVYGKGAGSTTTTAVASGATTLPIADISSFNASGGSALVGSMVIDYSAAEPSPSGNLLSWTMQTPPATVNPWSVVAYAPSIDTLCAVSSTSSATGIMTSTDGGVTWTNRTPSTSASWLGIAWAPSLSLFVVTGFSNNAMTSPDGITWTNRTLAVSGKSWPGVAWSPTLGLFATAAQNGIQTSPDGTTWTSRTPPNSVASYAAPVWADTLGLFVFAGTNLGGIVGRAIMTSPDGVTWTQRTGTTVDGYNGLAWSHELGILVAAAGNTNANSMAWSTDGINWNLGSNPSGGNWANVTWSAELGIFLAIQAGSVSTQPQVLFSYDGKTWTGQGGPTTSNGWGARGLLWVSTYNRFVAVSSTTTNGAQAATASLSSTILGALTGVSGLSAAVDSGAPVNIWVQRDDATAQSAYGVVEHLIADERRNETSLTALCDANLALYKNPIVTVVYGCRDIKSKSGKSVTISLSTPAISQTLIIQQVTITEIDIASNTNPRFTVTASTIRHSIDDILRQLLTGATLAGLTS